MTAVADYVQVTDEVLANPHRFRLRRAGVLNVWQYDDQVFDLPDGRLLLRGANGAGKSKTLEMLLPFAIDGDKMRITASGRHHTSLLWLMTDGYDGNRTGYVWVEFARVTEDGGQEVLTCGVGIRASSTSKTATSWYFTCPRQVGVDLHLEDDAGPLSRDRCRTAIGPDGQIFEQAKPYRAHVGRELFGLEPAQYDELLRLLYWLRQPQIGEDIEPAKLAEQLLQALPQVDDEAVRSAGDTFDELAAFGEQLDRRARAAEAVAAFAGTYADYARTVSQQRGRALVEAARELARRTSAGAAALVLAESVQRQIESATAEQQELNGTLGVAQARQRELESSPEARNQQRLLGMQARAGELGDGAKQAERVARRALDQAAADGSRVADDADKLQKSVAAYAASGHALLADTARAGADVSAAPSSALDQPRLRDVEDEATVHADLATHREALEALRPGVGGLLAAVQVVDEARLEADRASARRDTENHRAAEAEKRAEQARGRLADTAAAAQADESSYLASLRGWQADPAAVVFELPDLTAAAVAAMPELTRAATDDELNRLRADEAAAAAVRIEAERALKQLHTSRRNIEDERDPAPPEPALGRTPRSSTGGAPLWQLVDFDEGVAAADRAGLEAALEGSGLLDAWVRTDGAVLDAEQHDVLLALGPPTEAATVRLTLGGVLRPDAVGAGTPGRVPADVVLGVLDRIALVVAGAALTGDQEQSTGDAVLALDGSWRLGPLTGRATKQVAQYVGATARSAERLRRLAEVDVKIAQVDGVRADAAARQASAGSGRTDLERWIAVVPLGVELLRSWALLDERTSVADRAGQEASEAEAVAAHARSEAAGRRRTLDDLASRHQLPITAEGLGARRELLRALDRRLAAHAEAAQPLQERVSRWAQDWTRWAADAGHAHELDGNAQEQRANATSAATEAETLRASLGADIDELARRLEQARAEIAATGRRQKELQRDLDALQREMGSAETGVDNARVREQEQQPVVEATVAELAALAAVTGLVRSALDRAADDDETIGFELARGFESGHEPGTRVPAKVVELGRKLAALPDPVRPVDTTTLYAAWRDADTSDAADHGPRLVTDPSGLLGALGRDEGGEHPVAALAERLVAAVARDRELLTERERMLFEEHLIGELGEMLRQRRNEAEDLVVGMNRLLTGVTTSQGIAVRLHWQLRDDVPDDARRAVTLLGRTLGSLLPDERGELRDALHRLIEASRSEAPEDSYTEHLTRALDYRRWFVFRIRYTRPELAGKWHDLHRRSPLSQGEQKVVCYLPLFAAAAAHFTSLAGAAPHAPRFVLLDDAFPKIDVRTHPLLFGLLVAFDLDFVVTSERLWGDHPTLPSLAIYEALRDPGERGIAQFHYTWDGARLQAVGA